MDSKEDPASAGQGKWFNTTHWSVVLAARDGDPDTARKALEHLCSVYWPSIYAFLRRDGHQPADAEDLTQGFFEHLLEQEFLSRLRHQEGRFRSFLLKFLRNYCSDQRDKAGTIKRGAGKQIVSLDQMAEEERRTAEPRDALTPEQAYERRWAQALSDRSVERLRQKYVADGLAEHYERFKDLQRGERGGISYAQLAVQLGLTEQAVKNAVHRFRQRHQEFLLDEISQTLTDPADLKDEVRHLAALFAR